MRLHHLEITAFGPFAGTVGVDFDDLGAAGLFLLTGDTGAGKSSVLDAVCFALYGEVPGDRGGARHLRSDHAAPDAEPRVVLTFSVGDRRLRLSRSPAWDRPKRRGSGTRRIQAAVVAEEHRDGAWQAVSTRLDETGQLVGDLLGMTGSQFTQVAMLPQGRFQTFLRASSAERHDVLKRLFRTRRYDDVERWLAERRREAQRAASDQLGRCGALLDRLGEATGVDLPTRPDVEGAAHGGPVSTEVLQDLAPGELARWVEERAAQVVRDVRDARARETELAEVTAGLRTRLEHEVTLQRRQQLGEQARRRLAALDATADDADLARGRLSRDAAARPVLPHARRRHDADEALRRAARDRDRARGQEPAAPRSCDGLEAALADLTRRHGEARGWLPREAELHTVQARREHLRREADELRHGVAALEAETDRARRQVAGAESEREPLLGVVATRDALVAEAARAAAGESAARETLLVREELRRVVAEQQALAATALRLRSAHLDSRQARIEGAAAELAARLAVGCSCPVCGSTDHPAPARRAAGVGQDDEDAALAAFESAESARLAADEGVAGVRARLAAWEARSGGHDLAGWSEARERADAAVAGARRAAARLDALDATLARLRPVLERAGDDLGRTRAALAEREVALEELRAQEKGLSAALATLLSSHDEDDEDDEADEADDPAGDRSHDRPASVAALVADLAARCERLAHLVTLERAVDTAAATARQAAETADAAATQAGFADVDAALAAVLDDDEASRARNQVATWDRDHADATRVLGDVDVVAAMAEDQPDVAATRAGLAAHVEAHEESVGARRAAEHREHRVGVLRADLDAALAAWRPLRERHRSLAGLSSLVEGTSPDNRLRMRLTGYVLAERLRQVVAAANVRLAAMTDDRFALEHAEEKGAGEQRGGLSLRVRDDWSGTRRDPATLSGGESFVVSLALALGLADTVAQEAGGTTVETLFVDEGFGALDSDTLDAVMDVLDGLRDGGRVVGLVSHVAELRARVPAQLEVRKGRHGSTVAGAVHAG